MEETSNQELSKYSKIVAWFLILNGAYSFAEIGYLMLQDAYVTNVVSVTITYAISPAIAMVAGYYILINENKAVIYTMRYLAASIPIIGSGTLEYNLGHGCTLIGKIELFGLRFGVNIVPIIGIWLLSKHQDLTNWST